MKCIITGLDTDNKWKGFPISKQALEDAKETQKKDPWLTTREALRKNQLAHIAKLRTQSKVDENRLER